MKRFSFMFVVLVAFLAPTMAIAATYSFTIAGTVKSASYGEYYPENPRVNPSDLVEYVVTVNTDIPGSYTKDNVTTQLLGTVFSYLEKGALDGSADNLSNSGNDALNNYVNTPGTTPEICAGNAKSNLYLPEMSKTFSQWAVDDVLGPVHEISFGAQGSDSSRIDLSNATITKVETHATPLPAGILLLGSGVGALALVRRRVKISD